MSLVNLCGIGIWIGVIMKVCKRSISFFFPCRGRGELDLSNLCVMAAFGWKWCLCILCPVSHTSKPLAGLCKCQSGRLWPSYRKTRRLSLSGLRPVSQGKHKRWGEENIIHFSFFMTHINFPHVSTDLVRTAQLPDCDSWLNNTGLYPMVLYGK